MLVEPDVPAEVLAAAGRRRRGGGRDPLPSDRGAPMSPGWSSMAAGIRSGSLGDPAADGALADLAIAAIRDGTCTTVQVGAREVYIEVFAAPADLVVIGAGEIAVHLVDSRTPSACAPWWSTDAPRSRRGSGFARPTRSSWAGSTRWPTGQASTRAPLGRADARREVDDPAIAVALRRGARLRGGARQSTRARRRLSRLRESVIDETDLARIDASIGLDLGGDTPGESPRRSRPRSSPSSHRAGSLRASPADGRFP